MEYAWGVCVACAMPYETSQSATRRTARKRRQRGGRVGREVRPHGRLPRLGYGRRAWPQSLPEGPPLPKDLMSWGCSRKPPPRETRDRRGNNEDNQENWKLFRDRVASARDPEPHVDQRHSEPDWNEQLRGGRCGLRASSNAPTDEREDTEQHNSGDDDYCCAHVLLSTGKSSECRLTKQVAGATNGRAASPPRSVRFEREVRPRSVQPTHSARRSEMDHRSDEAVVSSVDIQVSRGTRLCALRETSN